MPVISTSRTVWILLLSTVVIGLLSAGAATGVSGHTVSVNDEIPAPVLYDIDNADGDGNYLVDWSTVSVAEEYILREAFNDVPPNDVIIYRGAKTSLSRTNMNSGQYCYRVRAIIPQGEWGPWSDYKCTVVADGTVTPTATNTTTATATPTSTHTPTASPTSTATRTSAPTATQPPPSNTSTHTPVPKATSTPTSSPTRPPRINLPIIMYQMPPTPTPTATTPPTPTNTPVPTNTPPPTPTNTPVPTNTPPPTPTPRGMIANGDFEKGRNGDWLEVSQNAWLIIVDDFPSGVKAHSGRWLAWLGGDNDEVAGITQTVSIPKERANFSYWIWISSQDICLDDVGGVGIDDGSETEVVDAYYLCVSSNTNGWVRRTLNLEKYAGQTVEIIIVVGTDSTLLSSLYVDDISLGENPHANENPSPNNLATGQPDSLVKELLLNLRSQSR